MSRTHYSTLLYSFDTLDTSRVGINLQSWNRFNCFLIEEPGAGCSTIVDSSVIRLKAMTEN
jgi:hypothetical protein